MKMMKYSIDKKVIFNNLNHSYLLNNNKLLSVTSLISKYKNKFDEDFYSKKIALKENKTQEEILLKWKKKSIKSCEIGTGIHKIFEDYTLNNYNFLNNNLNFNYYKLNDEFLLDFENLKNISLKFINDFFINKRLIPIHTEHIVYNDFLAGQIDMICKDLNNNFYILDFKTNYKIEYKSYNKKMLGVFNKYNDSNFYHYSLQLSIYKKLFKQKIKDLYIIHITNNNYYFIKCLDIIENDKINLIDLL